MIRDIPSALGLAAVPAPRFALAVEGLPLPADLLRVVTAVEVSLGANQPAHFRIEAVDPEFLLVDAADGLLAEGRKVEIAMGYAGRLLPMIEGEVTAIDVDLDESGGLAVGIEGFDALHRAARATGSQSFPDGTSDSAIVRRLAAEVLQMPAVVDEVPPRTRAAVQQDQSPLQLLQDLARHNDFQLWTEARTLFFMRRRPGPPVVLTRGRTLASFSARLSTAAQAGEIEVRSWDAARQQAVSAKVSAAQAAGYLSALSVTGLAQIAGESLGLGAGNRTRVVHAQGEVHAPDEAHGRAQVLMAEQRRNLLTARGSMVGDPTMRIGSPVVLSGMGRFSQQPFVVEEVTHRIDASGYRTTFSMRQYL